MLKVIFMRFTESGNTELKREYTEGIRKEIIAFANTDGGSYEARRSIEQALTFDEARKRFAKAGLELGENQMKGFSVPTARLKKM